MIMNAVERRALYNLLRMNWLNDPTFAVEPWQVEDYRSFSLPTLFDKLKEFIIQLDRISFIAYADECDSPEDLTDHLVSDRALPIMEEDQIYLVVFELWRRLMSEKPSLSVICNELDHQIYQYDHQTLENPLALQDILTHFAEILDENVDEGIQPKQAFQLISSYCANDTETFLYDFISEQIEEGNESYAQELLEDFDPYLGDNKWFKLLSIRLYEKTQNKTAQKVAREIIEDDLNEEDLEYHLELLSVMIELGDESLFQTILVKTLPLLKHEEDFQDLLAIAIDYFRRLDNDNEEISLKEILENRSHYPLDKTFSQNDPDLVTVTKNFNLQ